MNPGVLVGVSAGTGAALMTWGFRAGHVSLAERVAPYVPGGMSRVTPRTTVGSSWRPLVRLGQLVVADETVAELLVAAGLPADVPAFRRRQTTAAVAVAAVVALATALRAAVAAPSPVIAVLGCSVGAVAGAVGVHRQLRMHVDRRRRLMAAEFPTVVELIALSVAAGEPPVAAIERVSATCTGELAAEFASLADDVALGAGFTSALRLMGQRTAVAAIERFADAVAVAVDRGTPLVDVLRAQAVDAREDGRRELIEAGGRKEIAMLVPVVLLLLPVTVLFALYPSAVSLSAIR